MPTSNPTTSSIGNCKATSASATTDFTSGAVDPSFRAVFTEPPKAMPAGDVDVSGGGIWKIWQDCGVRTDAPLLGNGSMTAAFFGPPELPQFFLTTNDFWQMENAANWEFFHDNAAAKHTPAMSSGGPRPVGRLIFHIPAFRDASYHVEQDLLHGETIGVYQNSDGTQLTLTSRIVPSENTMVLTFDSDSDLDVAYDFLFPDETGNGCDIGVDNAATGEMSDFCSESFASMYAGKPQQIKKIHRGILSGIRAIIEHTDQPVKAGFAGTFLRDETTTNETVPTENASSPFRREDTASLHVKANEPATFVFTMRTWAKTSQPYEYALSRARWMTASDVKHLLDQHHSWWKRFWGVSSIEMDDALLLQRYHLSMYMMASLCGDADCPPSIPGVVTFDRPAWNGNYKINYNHQSPYLCMMVSGHFKQADVHDAPYLDLLDITREMSLRLAGHTGAYFPLGIGPRGLVSEALLLYMKSPAVHGALNMIWRWQLTEDIAYAEKIYPFLLSVAEFWEQDLVLRDGALHIVGDGMHERTGANVREFGMPEDPVNTLAYLHLFFDSLPAVARALDLDEDKIEHWKWISAHLAPYPVGTLREIQNNPSLWSEDEIPFSAILPDDVLDLPVFYDEGVGGKWSYHFPGNIMGIYPGNMENLNSDDELKQIAYNTIYVHDLIENNLAAYLEKKHRAGEQIGGVSLSSLQQDDELDPYLFKYGAWNASNLSCLFFPAAARVGYDSNKILSELREMLLHRGLPNGFLKENPHGLENLNTVPSTLQEMMLQSFDGTLRIFPNWPTASHPNAAFHGFCARGAFRVDARMSEGRITSARIQSLRGNELHLVHPYPGESILIRSGYRTEEHRTEAEIILTTVPGEELELIFK